MSRQEWDLLEWWEQRNYLDSYEDEVAEYDEDGNRKDGGRTRSTTTEGDSEAAVAALFGDGTQPKPRTPRAQQGSGEDAVAALFG